MTNEYYFTRPAKVRMHVDRKVMSDQNISVYKDRILLQWKCDERKVLETDTFEFRVSSMEEATLKVLELQTLNGDIFDKINIKV